MRAYFRVAPRFGVSMPWFVAVFLLTLWAILALFYWLIVLTEAALRWSFLMARARWRSRR